MTDAELLKRLERCFDKGEIETLIRKDPGLTMGPAVKVIHASSGLEVMSEQHSTQIRNKSAALLQLLQQLHEAAGQDEQQSA